MAGAPEPLGSGFSRRGGPAEPSQWRRMLGVLLGLSAVGIEMGAAVGIGIGVGYYLDRKLETAPWLLFFFSVCGLIAAGRALHRLIRRLHPPRSEEGKGEPR